jgi:hypothetical protein
MKKILCFVLLATLGLTLKAQNKPVSSGDSHFTEGLTEIDLKGDFCKAVLRDSVNVLYLVDFVQIPEHFSRVYFMNLSFSYGEIVNIDPDLTRNKIGFYANIRYPEQDILKIFGELKSQVVKVTGEWSAVQKSEWLKENDKYTNLN